MCMQRKAQMFIILLPCGEQLLAKKKSYIINFLIKHILFNTLWDLVLPSPVPLPQLRIFAPFLAFQYHFELRQFCLLYYVKFLRFFPLARLYASGGHVYTFGTQHGTCCIFRQLFHSFEVLLSQNSLALTFIHSTDFDKPLNILPGEHNTGPSL